MAGDRGLAFVVMGLIGISAMWLHAGRIPRASSRANEVRALARGTRQHLANTAAGQLAERKGRTIRQLAAEVSMEYRAVNSELRRLANPGARVAGELDRENRAMSDYLATLPGANLNRSYLTYGARPAGADGAREAGLGMYPDVKRIGDDLRPAKESLLVIENSSTTTQAGQAPPIE